MAPVFFLSRPQGLPSGPPPSAPRSRHGRPLSAGPKGRLGLGAASSALQGQPLGGLLAPSVLRTSSCSQRPATLPLAGPFLFAQLPSCSPWGLCGPDCPSEHKGEETVRGQEPRTRASGPGGRVSKAGWAFSASPVPSAAPGLTPRCGSSRAEEPGSEGLRPIARYLLED